MLYKHLIFPLFFNISFLCAEIEQPDLPPDLPEYLKKVARMSLAEEINHIWPIRNTKIGPFNFRYRFSDNRFHREVNNFYHGKLIIPLLDISNKEVSQYIGNEYIREEESLKKLGEECESRGLLGELFLAMIHNPQKFCSGGQTRTSFPPLDISECSCENSGAYDRHLSDRRAQCEEEILTALLTKGGSVRFMSLGCGEMLQEAILLGRLIEAGTTSIEIYLVDHYIRTEKVEKLQNFFEHYFPEADIKWFCARTVHEISISEPLDLIYAIDFDQALKSYDVEGEIINPHIFLGKEEVPMNATQTGMEDLIKASRWLSDDGITFFGYGCYDAKMSGNSFTLLRRENMIDKIEDYVQSIQSNQPIFLETNAYQLVAPLIYDLLNKKITSIHIKLVSLNQTNTLSHHLTKRIFDGFCNKVSIQLAEDFSQSCSEEVTIIEETSVLKTEATENGGVAHYSDVDIDVR